MIHGANGSLGARHPETRSGARIPQIARVKVLRQVGQPRRGAGAANVTPGIEGAGSTVLAAADLSPTFTFPLQSHQQQSRC
jgi:hypothetical protein